MRFVLSLFLILSFELYSQPTFNGRYNKEIAFQAVKDMKYNGVLVVRLKTNHIKISALQKELSNPNLKKSKRKRAQAMLDESILKRDAINKTLSSIFLDSFHFCPVYFSYDTSAKSLINGQRDNIFLNRSLEIDRNISIPDSFKIFVAYYHEKSGNYPTDGLILRRLENKLNEPFPVFTAVKESFLSDVNTSRLRKVIILINRRLNGLLARSEKKE